MSAETAGPAQLGDVLAEALAQLDVTAEPTTPQDHLQLIRASSALEAGARIQLHQAVTSARAAGATWSAVGAALGMSKQAAQKRFASAVAPTVTPSVLDERIIGPVTAFDEMAELELAGKYGWHSVEFGPSFHRVIASTTQWQHARVSMLTGGARAMRAQGWEVIGSSFPYTYLKRDLGTDAWAEPQSGRL